MNDFQQLAGLLGCIGLTLETVLSILARNANPVAGIKLNRSLVHCFFKRAADDNIVLLNRFYGQALL